MSLPISLKLSIRSIYKNKIQSLISILGLGIGLGSIFILLLLYIHENSFDRSIPNRENLYRVILGEDCLTSYPLGSTLKEESPLVESFFRIHQINEFELKNTDNVLLKDEYLACADSSIYSLLGVKILSGKASLSPNEICISSDRAKKYFGKTNPINQILRIKLGEQFHDLSICGVYKDFPAHSSLHPNFIGHIDLMEKSLLKFKSLLGHYQSNKNSFKDWNQFKLHTYIRLYPNTAIKQVEQQLQTYKNRTSNDKKKLLDYHLQAAADVYLYSNDLNANFYTRSGNPGELIYFLMISCLILIIAIVNYVFLTKSKIEIRMKDLGVQKAMGAASVNIFKQVLVEANLLSLISLIPASAIVIFGIPHLNQILNRTLNADVFELWQSYLALILIIVLTGSIAGLLIDRKSVV